MAYRIQYFRQALLDAAKLQREEPKAYEKLKKLVAELKEHPRTGTGKPEQLRGDRAGQWSRHITKKHRLVYEIHETEVFVIVLTAYGHYNDK
ncbi:MAG: Txe/YoeB family addiction module toxin [Bacteroidaceae bacterium]|nr:Txe/YoeB family addiction module toxin [Bacteroidaceae bacterium]